MIILFIKYLILIRNDEKLDQIGYKQKLQPNTNPVLFNDISLGNSNKAFKSIHGNTQNYFLNPNGGFSVPNHLHSAPPTATHTTVVSFENKSEDGNVSIPHIADFYPEG